LHVAVIDLHPFIVRFPIILAMKVEIADGRDALFGQDVRDGDLKVIVRVSE
jgi:hypothetical protein